MSRATKIVLGTISISAALTIFLIFVIAFG
ncbi:hypothetical protein [Haloquadratum walsbyi]